MRLASISLYPVKTTTGHDLPVAEVEPWGLAGDRRYLITETTDAGSELLTARDEPRLLACVPVLDDGALTLTGPHADPLRVVPGTTRSTVKVHHDPVELTDCGDEAAAWLSALVGRPLRLRWMDDPTRRPVNPAYGGPQDRVSLADGYPLLLASTASLERLDEWVARTAESLGEQRPAPLSMRRFRPSVVVDGADVPFAEDEWKRLRIGEVDFRAVKLCDRCVMTTVDPETTAKGKEPIRTLAKHRRWDGKTWFGVNLIPDGTGRIAKGDPVTVL